MPAKETNYHKHNRFYPSEFLLKPEFKFKNHLIALKEPDMELLEAALKDEELQEQKRAALASQEGVISQQNLKTGKDAPKGKDAKAKPAGKVVVEVDKNAPKPIEVDYPQIEAEPNFILIEKSFNYVKQQPKTIVAKRSQGSKSVANSAVGGAASVSASALSENPVDALAAKKQARQRELLQIYRLVRALPSTLAVLMKLNYVPPPPPPVE